MKRGLLDLLSLRRILSICEEERRQGVGTLILLINRSDHWTLTSEYSDMDKSCLLVLCYQKSGVLRGNFPTVQFPYDKSLDLSAI